MSEKTKGYFMSSDIFLIASLMCLGHTVKQENRFNGTNYRAFERTEELIGDINQYAQGQLSLDPLKYGALIVSVKDEHPAF